MNIVIDARLYGLENTGLGRYTMNLVNQLNLIDKKNNYYVLLRDKYFNTLNFQGKWKKIHADFKHYTATEQIKLPVILGNLNPDLVHFPHLNVPILYKRKFVVTIHDLIMQKQGKAATTLPLPFYCVKRIPFKAIARNAAVNSSAVIVPSNAVKNEVIQYYKISKDKIHVTYEGLSMAGSGKEKENVLRECSIKNKYFIYVGNVYPHKNIKRLVEAIKIINQSSNELISLVIVCARDIFYKRITDYAKDINAEQFIVNMGFVSDEKLRILYKNSVAFVYPSTTEGFGLQGLEAITSGTLVLSSDIPVFNEIYSDFVYYFDPQDVKSISNTMKKALKIDIKEKERMIIRGQKFLKRYSWRDMAVKTLEVYDKVLKMP